MKNILYMPPGLKFHGNPKRLWVSASHGSQLRDMRTGVRADDKRPSAVKVYRPNSRGKLKLVQVVWRAASMPGSKA